MSSVLRIPSEELKEILTGISKLRHNKGWEMVLPVDNEFISKYPEIVQRQNHIWEQRMEQLEEFIKDAKTSKRRKSKSVSEDTKVKKEGVSSENDSGTEKTKSPISAR